MFCFRNPVRPLLYYDNFSVCTLLLSNVMTGHVPWANKFEVCTLMNWYYMEQNTLLNFY